MTVKRIGWYFVVGVVISITTSCFYDLCLHFNWFSSLVRVGYSQRAMIFEIGQALQNLLWIICFYHLVKINFILKWVTKWCIDLSLVDIGFLIFSNPYSINFNKWVNIAIGTGVCIIQFIYFRLKERKTID